MSYLQPQSDISKREMTRGRRLKAAAVAAPIVFSLVPAVIFTLLFFIFGTVPAAAFSLFFFGMVFTLLGFVVGLAASGFFLYRHSAWTSQMREQMAARGIRAEEVEWFRKEMKPEEKRVLRLISNRDPLMADAYRETLASRLTASRIVKSSKKELLLMQRRQNKLKYYKTDSARRFLETITDDIEKIRTINNEAREMLIEAETRLQMIDAAATRGSSIADSEIALKKLSARAAELPLALESAKMTEEIRLELEKDVDAETLALPNDSE